MQSRFVWNPISNGTKATGYGMLASIRGNSLFASDWLDGTAAVRIFAILIAEGESSLSVQSVVPESTDIMDFESVSVLHAFADGMREQLENYAYTELCDYEGVFDAEQPIYGMRYTVTVNDVEMTTVTLLFLVEHRIYCLSFSDALQTELFPYAKSFLENLMISE